MPIPALALLLAAPLQTGPELTFVLLPDTQKYSEIGAFTPQFIAQTQWVADHLASQPIVFVTHVGDIVQNGEQGANANLFEWNNADTAMRRLDGDLNLDPDGLVPYGAVIGNHDYAVVGAKASGASRYVQYFGPQRYAGRSWYLGNTPDGLNHAQLVPTPEGPWLHIGLEWRPRDIALEFAQRTIAEHPGLPAIVTTHEHLGPGAPAAWRTGGATPDGAGDNDAEQVFRKLLEPNPEVVLLACGHVGGAGHRSDANAFGRDVHQILLDTQFDPNGGNGWMGLVDVDADGETISLRTFSPTYVPGVTPGLDRSTDPNANFDVAYDARGHREWLAAHQVARFREGAALGGITWNGARDTYVGDGAQGSTLPGSAYGGLTDVRCDGDADGEQGLIAFDQLFGAAPGRIPPGSTIERAVLTLTTEGDAADSGSGATLHRMLVPWSEASTWDSLGGGVQIGPEASPVIDVNTAGAVGEKGTRSFDVTAAVQAWSNGAPNHGWAVLAKGNDRWSFRSSEWGESMERPLLTVHHRAVCPVPARVCVATVNSVGSVGRLDWSGSSSVSGAGATLFATGLPAGQTALFIVGTQPAFAPLGDGNLCVGGDLRRLPGPVTVDPLSQAQRHVIPSEAALADIALPGATLRFQCWYRDATAAGSNLTDALAVTFCE